MNATNQLGAIALSAITGVATATTQPLFGFDPSIAVAGAVGASISILLQKGLNAREMFAVALCGTAASFYLTALFAKWVGADREALPVIGLLLGLCGIYLFRRIFDVVQDPQHVITAIRAGRWIDLFKPLQRDNSSPPSPQ